MFGTLSNPHNGTNISASSVRHGRKLMLWKMDQVNDLPIIIDMSTKPAQADTIINMSPRTAVSRGETSVTCYKIK